MKISIISEMDSRNVLYPLMRALYNHGTMCICTNNRSMKRFIDDDDDPGFNNIVVHYEESMSGDDMLDNYGIGNGDYDFIICDNNALSEYDLLIILLGKRCTERFNEEIAIYKAEQNVRFIQFGEPYIEREAKQAPVQHNRRKGDIPADYDPAIKWHDNADEDAKRRKEQTLTKKAPFYSSQHMEEVEAMKKFPELDTKMVDVMYELLSAYLGVTKTLFAKEMRKR